MTTTHTAEEVTGARNIIWRFSLRRLVIGASLFGLFAAVESAAQALGIVAAYPNVAQRAKLVYGLASNAALGLFYGDRHADIVTPAGYMVYRILPVIALVGGIWALTSITKMLRGQEENGRWELLLTGQSSARRATAMVIAGTACAIAVAYIAVCVLIMLSGHNSKFSVSPGGVLFYGLATVSGALVALGIGALASQLAATRRRAVLYGLIPLLTGFVLRSVGNVVDSLVWLKNLTPFGWIDKLRPFYHSQPIWLVPLFALTLICIVYAVWLAGKRDMGESLIADSATATPRLRLLHSQLGFAFRSTRNVLAGWLFASVVVASIIAAIDKTVAKTLTSTGSLSKTFSKLSGNPYASIELAYLGAAAYMIVTILMVMVTNGLGAAREEESSGRLDNLVSGTVGRRQWLSMRLLLLTVGAVIITLTANIVIWLVARVQGVHVGFTTLVFGGLSILGPVVFLLGLGTICFGFKPRLTTILMYAAIGWSFTVDIIASALKTSKYLADTSLLHHISLVPAANPKWGTFSVLVSSGLAMMLLGVFMFQKRDLQAE